MIHSPTYQRVTYKGIEGIQLENEIVRCVILPSYGGKMVSYYDKASNYEWLFQSTDDLKHPPYGADFSEYDSSGFDEMFPGIDEGPHPVWDKKVPDHGEVWTLPWSWSESESGIQLEVNSPTFPYTLKKTLTLLASGLFIQYEAINHSEQDFPFIWTPHALLNMDDQTEIVVPSHLNRVMNVEKGTKHLGEWGTEHSYPYTNSLRTGESINLSKLEPFEDETIEKFYFTDRLKEGWCSLVQRRIGRKLTYRFPEEKVPYLGVWKTRGGYRGEYNIALEPCTGVYDDVYVANKIDKVSSIPAHGSYQWSLKMELGGV